MQKRRCLLHSFETQNYRSVSIMYSLKKYNHCQLFLSQTNIPIKISIYFLVISKYHGNETQYHII